MPRLPRGRRTTTVAAALAAVVVLAASAVWLEMRATGRFVAIAEAAANAAAPLDVVAAAGRAHRFVFLMDVSGSDVPDRLAAAAVDELARSVGLDALLVSVSEDHQATIDRYMATEPEDESGIVARPGSAGGPGTPLLPLYRQIKELNRQLGAARSVRIVAVDPPGWPPARSLAPVQAVRLWAERDAHILSVLDSRILARDSRARAFFFVDGLHALRRPFVLRTGGSTPIEVMPVAARLAARSPREVWSALVDAPPPPAVTPIVAALTGSAARETLRREGVTTAFAVPASAAPGAAADWIAVATQPGVSFAFVETDVPLADVVDAYLFTVR